MRIALIVLALLLSSSAFAAGPEVVIQEGHANDVWGLAVSRDGKIVASGGQDGRVIVWDVATGGQMRSFSLGASDVYAVALSADGHYVAAGWGIGVAGVWDTTTGQLMKRIDSKMPNADGIDLSADGETVAVINADGVARVIRWRSGETRSVKVEPGRGRRVLFANGGTQLVVATEQAMRLFDLATLKPVRDLPLPVPNISDVRVSADGKTLNASGYDPKVFGSFKTFAVTLETGAVSAALGNKEFNKGGGAITPDGKQIFVGDQYNELSRVEVATNEVKPCGAHARASVMSADGSVLLGLSMHSLFIYDGNTCAPIRELKGEMVLTSSVAFRPGTTELLASTNQNQLDVWNLASGHRVRSMKINSTSYHLRVSPNGKYAAMGSPEGAQLFDLVTGQRMKLPVREGFDRWVHAVAFSPDSKYLAYTLEGRWNRPEIDRAMIVDVATGEAVRKLTGLTTDQGDIAYSPDGKTIVTVDGSQFGGRKLHTFDVATGATKELPDPTDSFSTFIKIAIAPNGHVFAVAGNSGRTIYEWDLAGGYVGKFDAGQENGHQLSTNPAGTLLAVGGYASLQVGLFDLARKQSARVLQHHSTTKAVAFNDDGTLLAVASADGRVHVWNPVTGEEKVTLLTMWKGEVALHPDGYYTASRGFRGASFRVGGKVVPFDQFDLRFNRPDKVLERIGLTSPEALEEYRLAYKTRLKRLGFTEEQIGTDMELPLLSVSKAPPLATADKRIKLHVKAQGKSALKALTILVNGVPERGARGLPLSTNSIERDVEVELLPGENLLQVSVLDEKGAESLREVYRVKSTAPAAPANVVVVAIGVSNYGNKDFDLRYAAKDASDLAGFFASSKQSKPIKLLDKAASRQGILAQRSRLEKTVTSDVVVLYLAGHGLKQDGQYYFASADVDFENPKNGGLAYDEIEGLLDGIPARRKMLLMDTCFSGEIEEGVDAPAIAKEAGGPKVKVRAVGTRGLKKKESTGPRRRGASLEMQKDLFTDVTRGSGAVVISAAGGAEFAAETETFKNGVFTYTLLEGLRTREADKDRNSHVSVSELRDYVIENVVKLTAGQQTPTMRRENIDDDFPVY